MAAIFVFAILKHFVPKKVNFPEGMGGFYRICGKSGGEGGYHFLKKMENPGRRSLVNFPLWWGYGYFLEPHIMKPKILLCHTVCTTVLYNYF